ADFTALTLRYLQLDDFKDIVTNNELTNEDIDEHKTLKLWSYSRQYWILHTTSCDKNNTSVIQILRQFLSSIHAVYWLDIAVRLTLSVEGLSLMKLYLQEWAEPHDLGDWVAELM